MEYINPVQLVTPLRCVSVRARAQGKGKPANCLSARDTHTHTHTHWESRDLVSHCHRCLPASPLVMWLEWTQKTSSLVPTGPIWGNYCPTSPQGILCSTKKHLIDCYHMQLSVVHVVFGAFGVDSFFVKACDDMWSVMEHKERLSGCGIRTSDTGKVSTNRSSNEDWNSQDLQLPFSHFL